MSAKVANRSITTPQDVNASTGRESPLDTVIQVENQPIVKNNVPITLSWENIEVTTPGSKDGLLGKMMFFKKEIPAKKIINDGN